MPRTRRNPPGGLVYHVLNRANRRSELFSDPYDYEAFVSTVLETLLLAPMRVLAFCLMPSHWHFLLWPELDGQLARFMHRLTTTHACRWNAFRGLSGTGHVYQGPYKFFPVQDDDHYLTVARYVERNALRAGLVDRAEAWPWGSLRAMPPIALSPGPLPRGSLWVEHVNAPQTDVELEAVRRSVRRGIPFGDDVWTANCAHELDLGHTLQLPGRRRTF